ncbi:Metal resistance protein YCF1 [Smittium mucronatum]|uniref:Metal resistance protein YCF1 n=1 Tax=Smittium mucronatum TaxID=133383 RepID=A0A1R0GRJ8_9FUNG|nr:Metal resistance protein YCF1 [Smittium mucronatum]
MPNQFDSNVNNDLKYSDISFSSYVFFNFMNPIVSLGRKTQLSISDSIKLPVYINPKSQSERVLSYVMENPNTKKNSLLKILAFLNWKFLVLSGYLKFIRDFLSSTQPLLLGLLIKFLTEYSSDGVIPISYGYFYAVSMFLVSLSLLLLNQHYKNITNLTTISVRASLIPAVYTKTLSLRSDYFLTNSVGKITNHMSSDASRVSSFFDIFHSIWSIPFQILLTLYILYTTIGISAFVGLIAIAMSIPLNSNLIKRARTANRNLTKFKDERIKYISELISNIKLIKMFSWETPMIDKITKIREDQELNSLKGLGIIWSIVSFVFGLIPHIVSLFTLGFYALFDNKSHGPLDARLIFVSLTLLNNLRFSLTHAPMIFSSFVEIFYSQERLMKFLTEPEFERNIPNDIDFSKKSKSTNSNQEMVTDENSLLVGSSKSYNSLDTNQPSQNLINTYYSLVMDKTVFYWDTETDFKLEISLELKKQECVAVIGSIGSGKSSLVSAIVGEMIKESGNILINGSIAYAPQTPWIMNATLRDNITFGQFYDKSFYDLVIEACELELDISTLPAGDMTEIGERGVNLSGGQKARVSMARAIYSKPEIILLDDTLSALDVSVGKRVFDRVIGPNGILKKSTRIVVTHSMQYISDFDRIIILKNGKIAASDKYSPEIHSMLQEMNFLNSEDRINEDYLSLGSTDLKAGNLTSNIDTGPLTADTNNPDSSKIITVEELGIGSVKWTTYGSFLRDCGLLNVFWCSILLVLTSACGIIANFTLKDWADSNKDKIKFKHSIVDSSVGFLLTYAFFGILGSIFSAILAYVLRAVCSINSAKITHSLMLRGIVNSPMTFFNSTPQGRILNRFSADQTAIDSILPSTFLMWASSIMSSLSSIIVISYMFPEFIIFAIPLTSVYLLVQEFYLYTSRQLKRISSTLLSPIYAHFTESVVGITTIRAFGKQEMFKNSNENKLDNYLSADLTFKSLGLWQSTRIESLGTLIVLFSSLLGVFYLQYFKNLDSALAALTIVYSLQFTSSLSRSVDSYCTVETNLISIERVSEYSNLPSEFTETKRSMENVFTGNDVESEWPKTGEIIVDDLFVRYKSSLPPVLKGISFQIKGGERVGVIGRTGSGKSTLASALFRLIEPEKGGILIDGIDTESIDLKRLRNGISIIPQESYLFSGTLRYNLDPMGQYTDEELWRVIEMVSLKEIVDSRSGGLEMSISNDGTNFSGGQKQLICLARVLLKKNKILILDEATASVDLATESILSDAIGRMLGDSTVVIIAHRLENVISCDKLMYFDEGLLIETGVPSELLKDEKSSFYKLYNKL